MKKVISVYFIEIHRLKSSSYELINKRVRGLWSHTCEKNWSKPSGVYRTQNFRPIDFSALISQLESAKRTVRAAAKNARWGRETELWALSVCVCVCVSAWCIYEAANLPNIKPSLWLWMIFLGGINLGGKRSTWAVINTWTNCALKLLPLTHPCVRANIRTKGRQKSSSSSCECRVYNKEALHEDRNYCTKTGLWCVLMFSTLVWGFLVSLPFSELLKVFKLVDNKLITMLNVGVALK